MSSGSSSTSSTDTGGGELLAVGRVGRAHGLAGAFHVTRPRIRLLREAVELQLDGVVRAVEHLGGTDARPVLTLAGVTSREQAGELRGADLHVRRSAAPELAEDEWYAEDLAGCRAVAEGRELGVVLRLLPYPSCDLLEVELADGGTVLVPLISDAVGEVDVEAGRIEVHARFLGLERPDAD